MPVSKTCIIASQSNTRSNQLSFEQTHMPVLSVLCECQTLADCNKDCCGVYCQAHLETQRAALRFERACSMHEAAKEMVQLAEQGYMRREQPSDPAWQEMLNHATMKVGLILSQYTGAGACMPSEHCVVYCHTGQRGPELSIFM